MRIGQKELTVELVNGTSVLELSYRDNDKDGATNHAENLDVYQDYSGAIANAE